MIVKYIIIAISPMSTLPGAGVPVRIPPTSKIDLFDRTEYKEHLKNKCTKRVDMYAIPYLLGIK